MSGTMSGLSQYGLGSPYIFEKRLALVNTQFKDMYNQLTEKPIEVVRKFLDLNKKNYSFWNRLGGVLSLRPTKTKINIDVANLVLEERAER